MYTIMYTVMYTIMSTIMYTATCIIYVKCILYVHDVQLVEIDPSGVGPAPYGFSIKKAKKTGLLKTVSLKTVPEGEFLYRQVSLQKLSLACVGGSRR